MKLVNRKTRKAIEKSVRKALKKHGPALMAAVAGSLVSSIATLASTEAADKPGKSNLTDMVDKATQSATPRHPKKDRIRKARRREGARRTSDMEDAQLDRDQTDVQHQLS